MKKIVKLFRASLGKSEDSACVLGSIFVLNITLNP